MITSAGLVLAATFAALGVIPILFLAQIAFIVAFGVLLDTFVVRSLLVPALSYDIGRAIWWPSKLSGRTGTAFDALADGCGTSQSPSTGRCARRSAAAPAPTRTRGDDAPRRGYRRTLEP